MALTKVLIAVKTYPTLSAKYDELVCTAGFKEDGTWIRIFPIQFRKKTYNEQYKKPFTQKKKFKVVCSKNLNNNKTLTHVWVLVSKVVPTRIELVSKV